MIVPVIPGLTFEHFAILNNKDDSNSNKNKNDSSVLTRIPRLQSARIKKGAFCFQWDAKVISSSTTTPSSSTSPTLSSTTNQHISPLASPSSSPPIPSGTKSLLLLKGKKSSPSSSPPPSLSPSMSSLSSTSSEDDDEEEGPQQQQQQQRRNSSSTKTMYYKLYAKGNILKCQSVVGLRQWWGFKCRCTCPSFTKQADKATLKTGETTHYVCEHLHAALLSVIDPEGFVIEPPAESFIPGLTTEHFVAVNNTTSSAAVAVAHAKPVLKRAHMDTEGYFHFIWEAVGGSSMEKSYELGAHGDINSTNMRLRRRKKMMLLEEDEDEEEDNNYNYNYNHNNSNTAADNCNIKVSYNNRKIEKEEEENYWWGFETYCTCPDFEKEYRRRSLCCPVGDKKKHYVCQHLAAALESAIDPDAQVAYEISTNYI
mmetsp:Transcript_10541/g.12081  ORF Transcript_10541/g.12081 Transcript_10541/m.12081 type:complete len:426 (-) Transcript_10541:404-1681(-)|eukprot:CAMPEP_0194146322 /NCGR_PEP_ID=MMETSP0152-20130528/20513_1 /TAXON_ID=1049557 /ORGANISM="Thalassiothrix antarctica, Strain L6-D1" /LENGTH=425 /DNA_ID=CAMNT_0038846809 /DNA_START=229 /DNA_END=1506 /DNA_ORIENTATION=+